MGRGGANPYVAAHAPEATLLVGIDAASLDFLAIRTLGPLGYDELSAEERRRLDQFERGHCLESVVRTYLHLLRAGASLREFLAAGSHHPTAISSTITP